MPKNKSKSSSAKPTPRGFYPIKYPGDRYCILVWDGESWEHVADATSMEEIVEWCNDQDQDNDTKFAFKNINESDWTLIDDLASFSVRAEIADMEAAIERQKQVIADAMENIDHYKVKIADRKRDMSKPAKK